jgi:membrane-bound metal-dependent hydrolase YbcI (DUF457 family)
MYIFARFLIAHLLSDIPLNLFASEKRNGSLAYRFFVLGLHTIIVFLTTLLFFVDKLNRTVFLCVLLVAGSHFIIDALRLRIERWVYPKTGEKPTHSKKRDVLKLFRLFGAPDTSWSEPGFPQWFLLNVFDQCLHLLILVLAASYLGGVL